MRHTSREKRYTPREVEESRRDDTSSRPNTYQVLQIIKKNNLNSVGLMSFGRCIDDQKVIDLIITGIQSIDLSLTIRILQAGIYHSRC